MYLPTNHIQQLAEYIKKNLKKGYTLDTLKFSLMSQGYSKITVENAIEQANRALAKEIPPIKEKPHIVYKLIEEDETGLSKEKTIVISETKKSWWQKIFKKF